MSKRILLFFLLTPLYAIAQQYTKYPTEVETVLKKAGKNRMGLEKAIAWCKKSGDPLKVKAIYFLIANMDIHYSADYYWADKDGHRVAFNEFNYPSSEASISAFNKLSSTVQGLHAIAIKVPDVERVNGNWLISDINNAFKAWKSAWAKNMPFADFCEYILPYRVSVEPIQDWRTAYQEKYKWFQDTANEKGVRIALYGLATNNKTWFHTTYGIEERKEPLPRLGAMQLLFRKKGPCEDIADLQVFALRSQGIPSSLNIIPYWATSTGSHFINTVFDPKMQAIQYDASRPNPLLNKMLNSEPSKVIRVTYARQPGTLASIEDINSIPDGFMRTVNYVDITNQYWETTDFKCNLFSDKAGQKIVYACVFNGLSWKPTWWGKVANNTTTFKNMTRGVVYLPEYYINGKMHSAGYPIAEGYRHEQALIPDQAKKISVLIKEEDKYLAFKPGKSYRLFYWDSSWKLLGAQTAGPNIHSMVFNNVPGNCLYLLLPEYTQKKERPFIITENGERKWF